MTEPDRLQQLWTSQKQEQFSMSIADIHARAETFQRRIRWRNWIEYAAGAVVVLAFTTFAIIAPRPLAQLACALIVLGALFVCVRLHMLARAASKQELAQTQSWAAFHRAELVRQRDALKSVWIWYLGPLVPGMVLFWISAGLARADAPLAGIAMTLGGLAIGGLLFWVIGRANSKAAAQLQNEIDALDRARE